jgi:hypothetical protein
MDNWIVGLLDTWINGLIRHGKLYFACDFIAYLFDLQQSINPSIQ